MGRGYFELNGKMMIKECEMIQVQVRCVTQFHLTTVHITTTIHNASTLKVLGDCEVQKR